MYIKVVNESQLNNFTIEGVSSPVANPTRRTVHLVVKDYRYWPSDDRFIKRVSRKLTAKNTFRYDGDVYDITATLK
jgi:hypothetical protein